MLHWQDENFWAYIDANFPDGANIQTFKPSSTAAFAMAFKKNDLPMIKMNSIIQNYLKERGMSFLLEIYIN